MLANSEANLSRGPGADLSAEEVHWLHQLEIISPVRALLPMRTTEKLGKLGLIELRANRLMLTARGRQLLHRL